MSGKCIEIVQKNTLCVFYCVFFLHSLSQISIILKTAIIKLIKMCTIVHKKFLIVHKKKSFMCIYTHIIFFRFYILLLIELVIIYRALLFGDLIVITTPIT